MNCIPFNENGFYVIEGDGYKIVVDADVYNKELGTYLCGIFAKIIDEQTYLQYAMVAERCISSDQFVDVMLGLVPEFNRQHS